MGRATFTIIAAIAEFERSIIQETVRAGVEYEQKNGTRSGKPVGPRKAVFRRDEVLVLRQQGLSLRQIARRLSVGVGTVRRVLDGARAVRFSCAETHLRQVRSEL